DSGEISHPQFFPEFISFFARMKILIVEDEKELAEAIGAFLVKEHFLVEMADDFESAREKIELYEYDCILLDIMLPGGSGLQLLARLKQAEKADNVIII